MDEELETLCGARAHPENENGGLGFSVPRMKNQPILEANSGFKICILRFHFSIFEAQTCLKFEAVFGLKNRVGFYGFQACSGSLCLYPWSPQKISKA